MHKIRIPTEEWGRVWRELIADGPITRIPGDHVYLVSDRQVKLLKRKKLPFELLAPLNGHPVGGKNA